MKWKLIWIFLLIDGIDMMSIGSIPGQENIGNRLKRDAAQKGLNIDRMFFGKQSNYEQVKQNRNIPDGDVASVADEKENTKLTNRQGAEQSGRDVGVRNRNVKEKLIGKNSVLSMIMFGGLGVVIFVGLGILVKTTFGVKSSHTGHDKKDKSGGSSSGGVGKRRKSRKSKHRRTRKGDHKHRGRTKKSSKKRKSKKEEGDNERLEKTTSTDNISHRSLMRRKNREKYLKKHKLSLTEMETSLSDDSFSSKENNSGSMSLTDTSSSVENENQEDKEEEVKGKKLSTGVKKVKNEIKDVDGNIVFDSNTTVIKFDKGNIMTTYQHDDVNNETTKYSSNHSTKRYRRKVNPTNSLTRAKTNLKRFSTDSSMLPTTSTSTLSMMLDPSPIKRNINKMTFDLLEQPCSESAILYQSNRCKSKTKSVPTSNELGINSVESHRQQLLQDIVLFSQQKQTRSNLVNAIAPGGYREDTSSVILFDRTSAKVKQLNKSNKLKSILRSSQTSNLSLGAQLDDDNDSLGNRKPSSRKKVSFSRDIVSVRYIRP